MLDKKINSCEKNVNEIYKKIRADEGIAHAFEMELINLKELKRLADIYTDLVSIAVVAQDNDKKPTLSVIDESGNKNEPLHFFSAVRNVSSAIGSSKYESYDDCERDLSDDCRVAEFREVMPDNHVDKDYFWRNIYYDGVGHEFRVGLPNESMSLASQSISKKDNEDYFDTVKIRRQKEC